MVSREPESDGQRYKRFELADVRRKGQSTARKINSASFNNRYGALLQPDAGRREDSTDPTQNSANSQQIKTIRRSSTIVGQEISESCSFVERCRFVSRWASAEIVQALKKDKITLAEALRLSQHERTVKKLALPPQRSGKIVLPLGEILAGFAGRNNRPIPSTGLRMSEEQRDLFADLANHLEHKGLITAIEREAIEAACWRRGYLARREPLFL